MPFPPEDIESRRVVRAFRGYDRDEVDTFLRAVAADHRKLLRRVASQPGSEDLLIEIRVPAGLNEEVVVGPSLDRLAAIPGGNFAVLVVDDGSDDAAADMAPARVPALDLAVHLVVASLILLMTAPILTFLLGFAVTAAVSAAAALRALTGGHGALVLVLYLMTFGLSLLYGFAYWSRAPGTSLPAATVRAHGFALYSYLWFPARWMAAWRMARGRRDWAKTARTTDVAFQLVRT